MKDTDLAAAAVLEAAVHAPLIPEGAVVFADRLRAFPQGCLTAELDGVWSGYAIAHPWLSGTVPVLGMPSLVVPDDADTLHLHDVALMAQARGRGMVPALLILVSDLARAKGLASISLVAVHGTAPLWRRHGFIDAALTPAGYGAKALALRMDVTGAACGRAEALPTPIPSG